MPNTDEINDKYEERALSRELRFISNYYDRISKKKRIQFLPKLKNK